MKALAAALLALTVVAGCGDVNTQPTGDSSTDDGGGSDTGEVTAPDGTVPDVVDEPLPDMVDEPLPDGATACEIEGGYCTTYALVATPCVTCEAVGGVTYVPARGPDGANECTAEGDGVGAWCCQPLDMADLDDCESAGGTCVPHGSERCPVGWVDDPAGTRCGGSHVCCVPGSSCP